MDDTQGTATGCTGNSAGVAETQLGWLKLFLLASEGRSPRTFILGDIFQSKRMKPQYTDFIPGGKSDRACYAAIKILCGLGALTKIVSEKPNAGWTVNEQNEIVQQLVREEKTIKVDGDVVKVPVDEPDTVRASNPLLSGGGLSSLQDKVEAPSMKGAFESVYEKVCVIRVPGVEVITYRRIILPEVANEGGV